MPEDRGAPKGDEVTLDAIKSILAEHETELETLHQVNTQRARSDDWGHDQADTIGLRPVENVNAFVSNWAQEQEQPALRETEEASLVPDMTPMPEIKKTFIADAPEPSKPARFSLPKFTRRRAIWIAICGFTVFNPGLVGVIILLSLMIVVGAFMVLGAERIWQGLHVVLNRISERDTAKGERIRRRLDIIALYWDSILDRFPEGMVDELYMPDFANWAVEVEMHETAVADRLMRMHKQV